MVSYVTLKRSIQPNIPMFLSSLVILQGTLYNRERSFARSTLPYSPPLNSHLASALGKVYAIERDDSTSYTSGSYTSGYNARQTEKHGGGMTDFIAYYRVSTDKQGAAGSGMNAQREAVTRFIGQRGECAIVATCFLRAEATADFFVFSRFL